MKRHYPLQVGRLLALPLVVVALLPGPALAEPLTLTFADPAGDQTGNIDVAGMVLTFDNATGQYAIVLTATAANPFLGNFRVNINLFNPDTGTTAPDPAFFQDTFNDFSLAAPTTTLTLTGANPRLLAWEAGDRVATTSTPFGNPQGTSQFFSAAADLPLGLPGERQDIIAQGDVFATVTAVIPEPSALALCGLGSAALVGSCRRRTRGG